MISLPEGVEALTVHPGPFYVKSDITSNAKSFDLVNWPQPSRTRHIYARLNHRTLAGSIRGGSNPVKGAPKGSGTGESDPFLDNLLHQFV